MSVSFSCNNEGAVHGRFQPPHLGHLEYITAAKQRCDFLWIGITRPNRKGDNPSDSSPHRIAKQSNPLTYYERITLLRAALLAAGLTEEQFAFTPFPIDNPELLIEFIPTTVCCFTTIYEEWNLEKVKILRSHSYNVEILWDRRGQPKIHSGTQVRELLKSRDDAWHAKVPSSCIANLSELQRSGRFE